MAPTVGVRVPPRLFEQAPTALRTFVSRAEAAGLDRLTVGDHVSFRGGQGFDGLLQCGVLAGLTSTLTLQTSVYLLALRHPVPTARQITTVANLAAGRFTLGVGLGGEDPHELEVCGVDPASRGRRLDECIDAVRALLTGEPVEHHGAFFEFEDARILPAPPDPVPVTIGGRSDAALRRTGRRGDGWIGLFCSAGRFREAVAQIDEHAAAAGRTGVAWRHAMHFWCSFEDAPDRLAAAMEDLYGLPFERFERYAPVGTPAQIAELVRPYLSAGASHINLSPVAARLEDVVDGAAEVKALLAG